MVSILRVILIAPSILLAHGLAPIVSGYARHITRSISMAASAEAASPATTSLPSWSDLQAHVASSAVGQALNEETERRKTGHGAPHLDNELRLFGDDASTPSPHITIYRDRAGWCPYCQKLSNLIDEKQIPVKIVHINMRSYGDKPTEFTRKVPGGLLPVMELADGRIITESQVIMELLEEWHPVAQGYRPMLPQTESGMVRYERLTRLERELFRWWCTLVFRPEDGPTGTISGGGVNNPFKKLMGQGEAMSSTLQSFLDCLRSVDKELTSTKGPWFFDEYDHPTMIDLIYVSHVERMLASCAYWKGLNLRDASKWNLHGLNRWLEAFERRESYFAFKSDYFTHVMDIPPQYGPGYDGGFANDRETFARCIIGRDGMSWNLPLPHDDALQPLYEGMPLPLCVLRAMQLSPDAQGSYKACDASVMARACRIMAAWKLSGNGAAVAQFAARGGPAGGKNPRKSFQAPLADPYAQPDANIQSAVDAALRTVCRALLETDEEQRPSSLLHVELQQTVSNTQAQDVASSLAYLRDRVGVPRDLPLAAARYLRAYLNWAIDVLTPT